MFTSFRHVGLVFGITLLLLSADAAGDDYKGSLSYGDGLYATQSWADKTTSISWIVTNEDPAAPKGYDWKYTYVLSVPKKDISHFILEASEGENPFTDANLTDVVGTDTFEVDLFHSGKSNPSMPGDLYGVKFDDLSDTDVTVSFYSDRAPVWGDLYAKGGKDKGRDVLMYNSGFADADPADLPSSGSFQGHLLRPDSASNPVPEPSLLLLLTLGGVGLLRQGKA